MDAPPEWDANKALAVTAYAGANRARQIIDAIALLEEMHGARSLEWDTIDVRCKTCRDGQGRPAPWPCDTYVRFAELFGIPIEPESAVMFRTFGQAANGSRRALAAIKSGDATAPSVAARARRALPGR